jgi:hypothetical protein
LHTDGKVAGIEEVLTFEIRGAEFGESIVEVCVTLGEEVGADELKVVTSFTRRLGNFLVVSYGGEGLVLITRNSRGFHRGFRTGHTFFGHGYGGLFFETFGLSFFAHDIIQE